MSWRALAPTPSSSSCAVSETGQRGDVVIGRYAAGVIVPAGSKLIGWTPIGRPSLNVTTVS